MGFELEWLDEEARQIKNVNVTNWVVDKERDIQVWILGKHWQMRAEGIYSETILMRIKGKLFNFELLPGKNFRHYVQGETHEYLWEKVLGYQPKDLHGYSYDEVVLIIKEALLYRGGLNKKHPNYTVKFNF